MLFKIFCVGSDFFCASFKSPSRNLKSTLPLNIGIEFSFKNRFSNFNKLGIFNDI